MTVFERIKELAKKHSKTMKQVTLDLGYSQNYFYSLKSGKQPSADKLVEIADYFGVSADYLLGRTDNPNPKNGNSAIKKPKVKMLARKMDDLDDSQLDALDNLVNQFFDKKFDKGSDEDK